MSLKKTFVGPETPTTAELMDALHAKLGLEKVNVFKMKEAPPSGTHPKIVRAYWMAKSMTDMWRTAFASILEDKVSFGLHSTSGMPLQTEELDWHLSMVDNPSDITKILRDLTEPAIDMTVARFGFQMRSQQQDTDPRVSENFRQANEVNRGVVTDRVTLSETRESEWNMEAASRQGFRAARDAEWRLMGVLPQVAVCQHDTMLNAEQALASIEGVGPTLRALAEAHEQVFLAIRAVLRGTHDHRPNLPYSWKHFQLADRHGRLTLELTPDVFEAVLKNPPTVTEPWTGCPSMPFLQQYHEWSTAIAQRFFAPHFPRIQQRILGQNTEPIRQVMSSDASPGKRDLAT